MCCYHCCENDTDYGDQNTVFHVNHKIRFCKKHQELQKPTQEEVLERLDAIFEEEQSFTEPPIDCVPSDDNPFSL